MTGFALKVKKLPKSVADFSKWEFDDGIRAEADRLLNKLLTERMHIIFSRKGALATLFLEASTEDDGEFTMSVELALDGDGIDPFAVGEIELFSALKKLVQYGSDAAIARKFAARLRELAQSVDGFAKDYDDGKGAEQ